MTYPSGQVVQTGYDTAGRATCLTSQSLSNCTPSAAYASSITYAPNNRANSIAFGSTLSETTTFNTRFQPTQVQAGSLLTLGFNYGTSSNNGNVQSQTITFPGFAYTQTYGYDGLGRLVSVVEDPNGVNYSTTYAYDVGNNLTSVNQSGQTRTFTYDSLNRLYQATNPESGTITYAYDAAGNLHTKTDGRGITATMLYEPLNRISSKTYSDSTPPVYYCYDGITYTTGCGSAPTPNGTNNLKLHQTMMVSSASNTQYTSYDEFGDVRTSQQTTGISPPYSFAYAYNKLSELTSMTYPSGRVVNTGYDSAGRANCLTSQDPVTCVPSTAYASSIGYAANNRVNSLTTGNNLVETTTLNRRFQPTGITAGSLLTLGFTYGIGNNNGNLQTQTITAPGQPAITQNYTYDGVNRLMTFTESTGTTASQYNCYDAFGNRYLSGSNSVCNPTGAANWIPYSGQTPTSNNFPNNHWAAGSGVTYDAAGNQIGITTPARAFTYDAENRQTTATINSVATTYAYDGDGKRVQKTMARP